MMGELQGVSFVFAALGLVSLVAQQGLAASFDSRPILEVDVRGDTYRVPVYEHLQYSDERLQFDREHLASLFVHFRKMIDVMLVHRRNHFFVAKAAMGVMPTAYSNTKDFMKFQKTDKSPPMAEGYTNRMGDVIYEILASRTDERIDAAEAKRRVDSILDGVQELANKSPVGLYLDWTKFTINGHSLSEYCAPIVRWFKENGYGMELKLFEALAALVKKSMGNEKEGAAYAEE